MRLLTALCAGILLAACLSACGGHARQAGSYISRGEIPVLYRPEAGIAGRWVPEQRIIYLSDQLHGWTLSHEMCHAADTMGISFEQVCMRVGEVPVARQMEVLRLVRAEANRLGGPRAGWRALYNVCGPQGVYHLDILANVKALNHLAKK